MNGYARAGKLKEWAIEEGFDRAGVARVAPSERSQALENWLRRGDHAEMRYLERRTEIRADPGQVLPGARNVLCVAIQYHPLAGQDAVEGDLWPGVAKYARGEDYHRFMEKGLTRLAARVEEAYPQTETKIYVDTGPILERELAARAGLGSVGKNTNLLDPEIGSWFLLGELFLTLDLTPDIPGSDLCGTCTRCLEACPTGALPEPYRLDSRLCISYWTIEHRGVIPKEIRPKLGEWVFGCDVCQEVCPVNLDRPAASHVELGLPDERGRVDLTDLLTMSRERYVEIFRHSPMKRSKLGGLQRNAAVTMGNSRDSRYVEPLIGVLNQGESTIRQHAAWALGRMVGERARAALEAALETESEPDVLAEIRAAIEVSG